MRIKKIKSIRSLIIFSSAFVLASVNNAPLVYGTEENEIQIEDNLTIEENIIDSSKESTELELSDSSMPLETLPSHQEEFIEKNLPSFTIKNEEKTDEFVILEGNIGVSNTINIKLADVTTHTAVADNLGQIQLTLPFIEEGTKLAFEIFSEKNVLIAKMEWEAVKVPYEEEAELPEEIITEELETPKESVEPEEEKDELETEKEIIDIILEKPSLVLNKDTNVISGVAPSAAKVEVYNDEKLVDTLLVDKEGIFNYPIKSEFSSLVLSFVSIDNEGNKSSAQNFDVIFTEKKTEQKANTPKKTVSPLATQYKSIIKGKTYHYIQSGETLNKIAEAYKVTVDQLLKWNPNIKDKNNISVGDLVSVDGVNVYDEIDKEKKVFNGTQDFIDYISPIAQELAAKNGIYASVMIAQAAHESGWGKSSLATIGNNLSGVKGSYEGNTIAMLTWEEVDGKVIWITDFFRLYPSYKEALGDYVDKLVNGLTYDPNFYNGTWVKNTASHMDATDWLTGRYATDSKYGSKLNSTISYHNLTKYDTHIKIDDPIKSQQYINYVAKIVKNNVALYSEPYGTASDKVIGNTANYQGKTVIVKQEKVNGAGTWSKLYIGNQFIGWVNKNVLDVETVQSTKNVNYSAKIVTKTNSIDSQPYGVEGFVKLGMSDKYYNQDVIVTQEKVTRRGTFAYITQGGKGIGWVDKKALNYESVLSTTNTQYAAKIVTKTNSIDTLPYGVPGFVKIGMSADYYNQNIIATQEKVTPRGTFVYITQGGKGIGWVDKKALNVELVQSTRDTQYAAKVVTKVHSIDTQPYGIEGFKKLGMSADYYNQNIIATQEKVTPRGTFVYITKNGRGIGWIDKRALAVETVLSTKNVHYAAKVVTKTNSIDTNPYGIEGFKKIGSSADYFNKNIIATQEKVTPRGTFVYIRQNGKGIGWVDKKALDLEKPLSTINVNYGAKIVTRTNSIDSLPYGLEGFKNIASSNNYFGKRIVASSEITTRRGTFVLISLYGKELGWIDSRALEQEAILSEKNINYAAKIIGNNNTIDTLPYGIEGFRTIGRTTNSVYRNKKVTVSKEITTQRGTFALISINGKEIGWLDRNALDIETVLSSKKVNYTAKIIAKKNTIDTKPYGIEGFEKLTMSQAYFNQVVTVSEEQVTRRGTFAFVSIGSKNIGWIDKKALEI